ncbi:MAG TPA: BBP7 family outer membrane beta-barrel protein [Pirellulales bacterium]|jgi:hypothetical protein
MSISRLKASLLTLAVQMLCVSVALGTEQGVQQYSSTHPPGPQQASGPPQPGHDRPGPGPTVGDETPSGIDAPGPEFMSIEDMEVWAPADISTYGAGIPANTGWWFSWDYLRYTVSPPKRTIIGNPSISTAYFTGTPNYFGASVGQGIVTLPSSITPPTGTTTLGGSNAGVQLGPMDTGFIGDGPSNGYRWEGGWMDKSHGFLLSAFRLYDNDQQAVGQNVGVPFYAPPQGPYGISLLQGFVDPSGLGHDADLNGNGIFGRYGANPTSGQVPANPGTAPDFGDLATLPTNFTRILVQDHRATWGAEADYVWRLRERYHPTTWEILGGVRYFRWDESFYVLGQGGVLDYSYWNTRAINNLVGPNIGLRFAHRRNRLNLTSEVRYSPMANIQNNQQQGLIAGLTVPGAPATITGNSLNLQPTGWNTAIGKTEFSNLAELRLNLQYQIFNKASVNVGWTGLIVDGIARPSDMINYTLPNMGLLVHGNNRQTVFMQGFTLGFIFNR